jgi:hypothetical protein
MSSEKSVLQRDNRLDITGLSPGIYFVKVDTEFGNVSLKFVKQ